MDTRDDSLYSEVENAPRQRWRFDVKPKMEKGMQRVSHGEFV